MENTANLGFIDAKQIAEGIGSLSFARQLQKTSNYSFKQIEKLLLESSKNGVYRSKVELAHFYKKHRMYKEALYWFDQIYFEHNHKLVLEIASWYEKGLGTTVNYDKAAKLYISITHSNNEALRRLITLYVDNKSNYGNNPEGSNLEYWKNLLFVRVRQGYWDINNAKRRL